MKTNANHLRKRFIAALVGTGAVALCCFTPILVVSLGVVGLSAMTPYLDYVLLPALVILILVAARAYQKWQSSQK
ncbi:MAG: mercury resistance system transport protein MerF [Deltaproteobacteria bacterium]|nr:MAG: mercury resistance system transport protein MerF [Deltaproteobacteria bacterium]